VAILLLAIRNGLLAVAGLILPLVLACAVILVMMPAVSSPSAPNAVRTPSPSRAPWHFFGPADYLVYCDVSLGGRIVPWFTLVYCFGGTYVLAAAIVLPFLKSSPWARALTLFLVSLTLGFVAASPWWYCIAFHRPD
jgi:hypothetical protein